MEGVFPAACVALPPFSRRHGGACWWAGIGMQLLLEGLGRQKAWHNRGDGRRVCNLGIALSRVRVCESVCVCVCNWQDALS